MKQVSKNIFVGTIEDFEEVAIKSPDWFSIIAAKEPYHRRLVGYTGRACDKEHENYFIVFRDNCVVCNLIDVEDSSYVKFEMIKDALMSAITELMLTPDKKILVCCNKGESRSPVVAMLLLRAYDEELVGKTFEEAETAFKKIYPQYNPKNGIRDFAIKHWDDFAELIPF